MKKNILLYAIILIALIIGSYFLVFKQKLGTLSEREKNFAVEDVNIVQKIFMADKSGHTILLKKTSEGWTVTDEKNDRYPVKKSPMRILLKTIKTPRS